MDERDAGRRLEIYVAPDCFGCDIATELASKLRTMALPNVDVRLIDLGEPESVRPDIIFAVPTYVLDGQVLSLGNPDEEWLIDQLTAVTGHEDSLTSSTCGGTDDA